MFNIQICDQSQYFSNSMFCVYFHFALMCSCVILNDNEYQEMLCKLLIDITHIKLAYCGINKVNVKLNCPLDSCCVLSCY